MNMFVNFLTSKTGLFLKKPLVLELAETIDGTLCLFHCDMTFVFISVLFSKMRYDMLFGSKLLGAGMASTGEANLLRVSRGLLQPLPGGNGPVNDKRMEELTQFVETLQSALSGGASGNNMEDAMGFIREILALLADETKREEAMPILDEVLSVCQQVAVQILEIRGKRAMRNILRLDAA